VRARINQTFGKGRPGYQGGGAQASFEEQQFVLFLVLKQCNNFA
jgi:hypothetical protein